MKKIINYNYLWILSLAFLSACSDMNELHQPYLDMGEHIYAAKINSAVARSGNKRIQLDLFYTAQRIKKCCIYWNVRQDSLELDLPASGKDGIPVIFKDLAEGTYSFEVVTLDKDGNRSLPVEATGRAYGSNYEGSLSNIKIASIDRVEAVTTILWKNIEFATEIEFTYDTTAGKKNTIKIPIVIGTKTLLTDALPEGSYSYTTYFKPTVDAIDSFKCNESITGNFPK